MSTKTETKLPFCRDSHTGKKSVTITGFIVTGLLLTICQILVLLSIIEPSTIGWFWLPCGTFAGLYLNKRIRINKDSVEITGEESCTQYL